MIICYVQQDIVYFSNKGQLKQRYNFWIEKNKMLIIKLLVEKNNIINTTLIRNVVYYYFESVERYTIDKIIIYLYIIVYFNRFWF